MFVFAAMIEFAGILFLKRMNDVKEERKVEASGGLEQKVPFKMQELSAKIDGMALIVFSLIFITFNVCYWIAYLNLRWSFLPLHVPY